VFTAPYVLVAYIQHIAFSVYSAVGLIAYINMTAFTVYFRYGLIAYIQQVAFCVYSAVRTGCLYTAHCI